MPSTFSAKGQCGTKLLVPLGHSSHLSFWATCRDLGAKERAQPVPGKKCLRPTQMSALLFRDTGGLARGRQG